MWRRANSAPQKIAVLDGLLPITTDEFLKAVMFFCGDDDESVWQKAAGKLKDFATNDIRKNINAEIPEKSVLALAKLAGERKDASLVISLLGTEKLDPVWLLTYVSIQDEEFWKHLITHKDFIVATDPQKDEFISFFGSFSPVLHDLYIEQGGYISSVETEDELSEEAPVQHSDFADDEDVVELGDESFDFPDFLLSEEAFEGLNADDMMERRKTIMQALKDMTIGQKIKIAMMGNLEVRKILIKDPRKQIALSVLNNPRITEKEVAAIAGDAAVALDIVSYISAVKSLSKSYQVKLALVNNPKTPLRTSLALLDVIRMSDLKNIAKSRNIPNVLKMKAKKKIK